MHMLLIRKGMARNAMARDMYCCSGAAAAKGQPPLLLLHAHNYKHCAAGTHLADAPCMAQQEILTKTVHGCYFCSSVRFSN